MMFPVPFPTVAVPRIRAIVLRPGQPPHMQELVGFTDRSWTNKPESIWADIEDLVGSPEWWQLADGTVIIAHDTRNPDGWPENITLAFDRDNEHRVCLYGPVVFVSNNDRGELCSLSLDQIVEVLRWIDESVRIHGGEIAEGSRPLLR
ncbi:hypothetical protein [Sulfobacillus harzensis]|uniref:Uncharacterized protein n=1 Tax=Sulfobacillus harzensis TaxID=2729629 RepID=A0A7Y0L879_9FIRM|nr:hypothetical protein [Sulfobacillus harzensis]NMP24255.1 hypothetical protein [Sulfobacillus harzensis]